MNLDRFSEGLPDIQDMPVVDYCEVCGEVIIEYIGDVSGICGLCQWSIEECEEE